MSFKKIAGAIAVAGVLVAAGAVPGQAATLDDVKAAGTLKCGINTGLPGFAYTDDAGNWTGFRRGLLPGAGGCRPRRCQRDFLRQP